MVLTLLVKSAYSPRSWLNCSNSEPYEIGKQVRFSESAVTVFRLPVAKLVQKGQIWFLVSLIE